MALAVTLAGRGPVTARRDEQDDGGDDSDHGDRRGKDPRQDRPRQRLAPAQRALVTHPFDIGGHREHPAERDQRQAEQVTADRDAGERREQLHDAEPGHHQGERRPAPGEERALVGEGEPRIGLGAAGILATVRGSRAASRLDHDM